MKKEKALEFYLKAEKFDKNDISLLSDIAWHYDALDRNEEALKYIKRVVRLGRDDAWINEEYGACLSGLGKYKEAIKKYEYALSLDEEGKDERYINSQLGWCYRQLEEYKKAIKFHKKQKNWEEMIFG